ncbi:hypothetical protein [Comamonas sp.]|uniref:hypothetical protein n=1 Tax=Comamonas sp. TaxID=34028 RepID=UPI0028A8E5D4|nr:hypothetical protein [Comamonas sp.]
MTDSKLLDVAEKAAKYDHLLPYLCKTCGGYGLIDRRCYDDPLGWEPCPDCNQPAGALAEEAVEELYQLGYTVKDGRLVPPDHVGELIAVVQAAMAAAQEGGKA